jgi:hypothetical protein
MHIADKNFIYFAEILNNYLYVSVISFTLYNETFVHKNGNSLKPKT